MIVLIENYIVIWRNNMKDFAMGWLPTGTSPEKYRMKIRFKNGKTQIKNVTIEAVSEQYSSEEFGTILKELDADFYRDKRVCFSGTISTSNVTGWSGLWLKVCDNLGNTLKLDNMLDRAVTGSVSKKECSCIMDIPSAADEIYIGFLLCGGGKIRVEDINFQVLDFKR